MFDLRRTAVAAVAVILALTVAGCGGSEGDPKSGKESASPRPTASATASAKSAADAPEFADAIAAAVLSYKSMKTFSSHISLLIDGKEFDVTSSFADYQDLTANASTVVRTTLKGAKKPVTLSVYRSAGKDYSIPPPQVWNAVAREAKGLNPRDYAGLYVAEGRLTALAPGLFDASHDFLDSLVGALRINPGPDKDEAKVEVAQVDGTDVFRYTDSAGSVVEVTQAAPHRFVSLSIPESSAGHGVAVREVSISPEGQLDGSVADLTAEQRVPDHIDLYFKAIDVAVATNRLSKAIEGFVGSQPN